MNLVREKIQNLINQIKEERKDNSPENREFVFIELSFDFEEFFSKCNSIGHFMKKLKNGKLSLPSPEEYDRPKQNNREYFNDLIGEGGFYRYEITDECVFFNIFFQVKREFDTNIDNAIVFNRVSKITQPHYISIEIGSKSDLKQKLDKLAQKDIGWSIFGSEYKNWGIKE